MVREEESFLQDVTEKIKKRIERIDQTLLTGQKEIENMHDYYWEIIRKWTSTDMKTTTISRLFLAR